MTDQAMTARPPRRRWFDGLNLSWEKAGGVIVSINSDDAEEATHLNQEAAKSIKFGGLSRD